jgi:CheY-like chemotaxis protein
MRQSARNIFNLLTLRFRNKKLDQKFDQSIPYLEKKKVNLRIGLLGLLISSFLLIWSFFLSKTVDWNLQHENLSVHLIEKNQTGLYSNNTMIYYEQYVMVSLKNSENLKNSEKNNNNDLSINNSITPNYIPLQNDTINYPILIKQYAFTARLLPMCLITCIFHFFNFTATLSSKSWSIQTFLFLITYLLLGYNFHLLSAIFLIFYGFTTYSVFFIVTTQLFIKMILIMLAKVKWTYMLFICILTILVEWVSICLSHHKVRTPLILYLSVNDLIHLFSIIFSYYTEFNNKTNFYLLHQLNFEREYLINFLFNMEEGFFTFSNNKILFMNKSMQNIVNTFAELMKFYINPELNQTEALNNLLKNQKEMIDKQKVLDTSIAIVHDTKFLIEKLLENVREIDKDLSSEVKELFSGKSEIKLNELLNLLKNEKNFNNEFITLGVFDFENISRGKLFESQLENAIDIDLDFEFEVRKKYSVFLRVIENAENHEEFLEMKFSDNFSVNNENKEKNLNDNLTLFIPKIAHELKNPLKYLFELNENIQDSCKKNETYSSTTNTLKTITTFSENSRIMCQLMKMEIKNLFVISKIKSKCLLDNSCNEDLQINCTKCNFKKICSKCKTCSNCEQRKKSNIDFDHFIKEIFEIFTQLSFYEKKKIKFLIDQNTLDDSACDSKSSCDWLKFLNLNSEIIQCIIFNLIYFSYKNTQEGEVVIHFHLKDQEKLKISVNSTGKEIDSVILNNLSQSKNFLKNFSSNKKFSKFNFYSNLIFSHFLIKNIGSYLIIESEEGNNKFSFIINSVEMKTGNSSDSSLFDSSDFVTKLGKDTKHSTPNNHHLSTKCGDNRNSNTTSSNKIIDENEVNEKKNNLDFSRTITSSFDSEDSEIKNNTIIHKKRILILDDQAHIRETLIKYFKKFENNNQKKFEIIEAENPFDALNIIYKGINTNTDSDKQYFDLLIYDQCMPLMKESNLIENISHIYNEANLPEMFFINYTAFDNPDQFNFGEEVNNGVTWMKPVSYREFEDFFKE